MLGLVTPKTECLRLNVFSLKIPPLSEHAQPCQCHPENGAALEEMSVAQGQEVVCELKPLCTLLLAAWATRPARQPRWRHQPGKSPSVRCFHAVHSHTWGFGLQSAHLFLIYFILLISDDHFRMLYEQSFSPPDLKASAEAFHLDRFF